MPSKADATARHSELNLSTSERVCPRVLMYADLSNTHHTENNHYYATEVADGFSTQHRVRADLVIKKESLGYAEFPALEKVGTHHDLESFIREVESKANHVTWKEGVKTDDR